MMGGLEQLDWYVVLWRSQAAPQDDFLHTKSPMNYCEMFPACSGKSKHATFTQYSHLHKQTCLLPQTSSPQWSVTYWKFDIISFGVSDRRQEGSLWMGRQEYSDTYLWKRRIDLLDRMSVSWQKLAPGHVSQSLSCHMSTCQQIMLYALRVCLGLGEMISATTPVRYCV